MSTTFSEDVVHNLPRLKNFALRLARNRSDADDLVQETILRALVHADQFRAGTNLLAWLNTILRNYFFTDRKLRLRTEPTDPLLMIGRAAIKGDQESHVYVRHVARYFANLPSAHREALVLVGASGHTYEVAAEIAGCPVGTMKSRVSRARSELRSALVRYDAQAEPDVTPGQHLA
jgi:RNA polymerase sigma-70 factor, ECF subfamily